MIVREIEIPPTPRIGRPPGTYGARRVLLDVLADGAWHSSAELQTAVYGATGRTERAALKELLGNARRSGARIEATPRVPWHPSSYRLVAEVAS